MTRPLVCAAALAVAGLLFASPAANAGSVTTVVIDGGTDRSNTGTNLHIKGANLGYQIDFDDGGQNYDSTDYAVEIDLNLDSLGDAPDPDTAPTGTWSGTLTVTGPDSYSTVATFSGSGPTNLFELQGNTSADFSIESVDQVLAYFDLTGSVSAPAGLPGYASTTSFYMTSQFLIFEGNALSIQLTPAAATAPNAVPLPTSAAMSGAAAAAGLLARRRR